MRKSLLITIACLIGIAGLIAGTALPSAAKDAPDSDYVLGPRDEISIHVWENEDLNRTVTISDRGEFSFPFIGKVRAEGLSVFGVETELKNRLADGYLVAPQVTVSVQDYGHKKIFLHGEVKRPGSYVIRGKTDLLTIISDAGGFTDDVGEIIVVETPDATRDRNAGVPAQPGRKNQVRRVNVDALISGDAGRPVEVGPGDIIYVSKAEKVLVTGEVKNPGSVKWKTEMTVRQAISLAGGPTSKGAMGRTEILRLEGGKEQTIRPDMAAPVRPGDIIKVPESYF